MISKWFQYKNQAIKLRKEGFSIKLISKKLGIPVSTLSGWFKNIELTSKQKKVLKNNWRNGLVKARKKALVWHNSQKMERLAKANHEAEVVLSKIDVFDSNLIDLSLAMLYFGEGFKKSSRTGMGNSDPLILKFFLKVINIIYNIPISKIRCSLHLRADQDPEKMKKFWSKELKIPANQFSYVSIDKRTKGNPTYSNYKGVCLINCGNIAIQRKLIYLSRGFCEKVIEYLRG